MKQTITTVLFDADDTLWESGKFFVKAEHEFLRLCDDYGIDRQHAKEVLNKRDVERLVVTGYGVAPYNDTLAAVLKELAPDLDDSGNVRLKNIQDNHYNHPLEIITGVKKTLEVLRKNLTRMYIYTKGEETHQKLKIDRSGLLPLFDGYFIVPDKNPEILREILVSIKADPEQTAIIGDSIMSDINPGLRLGLTCFHVPHQDTWNFMPSTPDSGTLHILKSIADVLNYLLPPGSK